MMVRVPLGESDVGLRLAAVTGATKQDKARHQALGVSTLLSVLEIMPQRLIGVAARSMHRQPVLNVVVTNVPGPGVQLYALGARLLEAFPVVPLAGNLPIGVAALSYGGQLGMGVLVDPVAVPDLDVLVEGIEDTFAQLLTLH
jgi:hypothetical protein